MTVIQQICRYLTGIGPIYILGFAVLAGMTMIASHEFDVRTDISRLMTLLLSTSNIIALSPHLVSIWVSG